MLNFGTARGLLTPAVDLGAVAVDLLSFSTITSMMNGWPYQALMDEFEKDTVGFIERRKGGRVQGNRAGAHENIATSFSLVVTKLSRFLRFGVGRVETRLAGFSRFGFALFVGPAVLLFGSSILAQSTRATSETSLSSVLKVGSRRRF